MSKIYDDWERLVAAVLKKEQLWQLFHAQSRSPSLSSESSGFSFSLGLNSSLDDVPFTFPDWSASNQKGDDDIGVKTDATTPSSILVKDQPNKNVTFTTPSRKRNLKIEVPNPQIQIYGPFSPKISSPIQSSRVHLGTGFVNSESHTNWPDEAKQQSYPLPLPPEALSNTRLNSAATSPTVQLRSPERTENRKSPSWKKGKLIGRGALGDVYIGFNSEKGEMCAMKEFNLSSDGENSKQTARMLEREIALLSSLKHPNIVPYYGSELVGDHYYIYLEYVSGGSIYSIMQEYGKLGESAIRSYTQQILSGLAYLHSKSITHRDIKGANILVDPTGKVKLSNFGIEKHMAGTSSLLKDSPYWLAPEVVNNPYVRHRAIDIWSLGCTVIEMATSKPPMNHYKGVTAMFKVSYQKEVPTIPDHLSDEGKDFLRQCLQWNPMHRATASQLLDHPFVKSSSPLGRHIRGPTFSGHPMTPLAPTPEGIDRRRNNHHLDSRGLAGHPSRASKSNFQPSNIYTPRNISAPVSPLGSPLRHPRSPQHPNREKSPPSKSNPRGPSTPLVGGNGATRYPHRTQVPQETFRNLPKDSPSTINSPSYWDPNILRGLHPGASPDNDSHRKQFVMAANGQVNEQSALADRVFQQVFRTPPTTSHRMAGV